MEELSIEEINYLVGKIIREADMATRGR